MIVRKETDELSKEIMKTAQQLFDRHGVEAVSMHQVAKTVGIGQGTLYRRYPNKGQLCLCLMESKFERFKEEVGAYLTGHAGRPASERLSTVMRMVVELLDRDMEWVKAVCHSEKLEDARVNLFELPPFVFYRSTIQTLLEEAAAKGELRALDPMFASSLIASSLRPELLFYLHDLGYSSPRIAELFIDTFIAPLFVGAAASE